MRSRALDCRAAAPLLSEEPRALPLTLAPARSWAGAALGLGGCLCLAGSYYLDGGWLLAWFALLPLLTLAGHPSRAQFWLGVGTAVLLYGPCVSAWLVGAARLYALHPPALAAGIAVTWLSAGALIALWLIGARVLLARCGESDPIKALLLASAWVAIEFGKIHAFPWIPAGGPIFLLGYTQAEVPALIQTADLAGVHGISFAVALVNAALYLAAFRRGSARPALLLAVLTPAFVGGYGAYRLAHLPSGDRLRIAAVRVDLPADVKWHEENYRSPLAKYADLTRQAAAQGAEVIVWPESAVPLYLRYEARILEEVAGLARESQVRILLGAPDLDGSEEEPSHLNSAFLVGPDGRIEDRYVKREPVPFAERLPAYGVLRKFYRKAEVQSVDAGADQPPLLLPSSRPGVFICWEAAFSGLVRASIRQGADLLINLTNETTLGSEAASRLLLHHAALRTVEFRRWMVRAAMSVPPAVVSPEGRILSPTGGDSPAVMLQDVDILRERTFYERHGDVLPWACAVVTLVSVGTAVIRERWREDPVVRRSRRLTGAGRAGASGAGA